MRVGLFYPEINIEDNFDNNLKSIGSNTGNNVFWYALNKLLCIERIPYDYTKETLNKFDKIITTDLIWIQQNKRFEFLEKLVNETNVPIIPISIGLQANTYDSNFELHDETVKLIKKLEERANLGVRGEYTASILSKYKINNFTVIGCPSMYYWNDANFRINNEVIEPKNVIANFKTFYGVLSQKERHFLSYCADRNMTFIEQTSLDFNINNVYDVKYFEYVNTWLNQNKKIFLSIEDWNKEIVKNEFTFGSRFHGNVISLWNGVKALSIITDSRTRELTSHFSMPTIEMENFDRTKSLIYYNELADFDNFNKNYGKRFKEFQEFIIKNGLLLNMHFD